MSESARQLQSIQPTLSEAEFAGLSQNSPINILYCDRNFIIRYANPKSMETLKLIAHLLPVPPERVVGSNVDIFHKDPKYQRRILSNEANLPHRAIIELGPEKLDLNVSPIFDADQLYIGAMVTWDIVTKQLALDLNLARMQSMIENAPINILLADLNFNLVYMNPASRNTLKGLEKYLPMPVDQLVGKSIDIFHKNPQQQRRMLADDRQLPHRAKIKLGPETLMLSVSAMYDQNRKYLGPMVTWEVLTDKVALVEALSEASRLLAAASAELNATATQMTANASRTSTEAANASSASEQVSRGVRTVATNTEEMSASIKEIARNANEASMMSNSTLKEAQVTNSTVTKLGESSQEIGNVIKVISSIAQQTNLLALNATIEAARAGDAGRGFAVVANEVKELAKQTAKATEDITNKIGSIQKDSQRTVEAISTISHSIEKLNSIAGSIAASVEEQQATTNEVARVVQESSLGVDNISANIRNVSTTAGETHTGANQVLDAAKSLTDLALKLEQLVKQITI